MSMRFRDSALQMTGAPPAAAEFEIAKSWCNAC